MCGGITGQSLNKKLILIRSAGYISFLSYREATLEARHQFADNEVLGGRTDTVVEFVAY
jgi:hypothetical protein